MSKISIDILVLVLKYISKFVELASPKILQCTM